jgi:hypothetical protein
MKLRAVEAAPIVAVLCCSGCATPPTDDAVA